MAHETRAVRNIRPYLRYDDEALYVGADLKDSTPMVNPWNSVGGAGNAWDSDAFQMRLSLEPTYPGMDTTFTRKVRKERDIAEYGSQPATSPFPSPAHSLRLPVKETPGWEGALEARGPRRPTGTSQSARSWLRFQHPARRSRPPLRLPGQVGRVRL